MNLDKTTFLAIGLMSGSSLDGLDICAVEFSVNPINPPSFAYKILAADCIEYDTEFRHKLRMAATLSAYQYAKLHTELGRYFGQLTQQFILQNKLNNLDFVCSHGQTIFHQPNLGFTAQIGCGAQLAAQTNCKVVCDLRVNDIAYNGQGAPIVPIAERYLFPNNTLFLNIGGIANIALHQDETIFAYDICAANTLLNYFAKQKEIEYDKNGAFARSGTVCTPLLDELNAIEFCKTPAPKSLGSEHIYEQWIPLFSNYTISIEDKLATAVEHIAMQVGKALQQESVFQNQQLLVTGGGAFNTFLIERIQQHCIAKIMIPDSLTVQYKEALAMAFIGLLRVLEMPNCLASVTGASKNVIGGAVYLP